jgi:23S rRNA (uracil1939-C5)-methyltransferase
VGDLRFRIGGTAFFQVSGLAASRLTSLVLEEAKLVGTERVLELYCGAGTFTVPLAKRAKEAVGIETNPAAASDGTTNLRENGCTAGRIIQGQVEQTLPALAGEGRWNLVVLDPPRQGCSRAVIDRLGAMRVARVIYVSCDPSTLARDLGILAQIGYACVRIRPVDLFPQTFHLETVAVLER